MKRIRKKFLSLALAFTLMIVPTSLTASADYATMVTDFIVTNTYLYKNGYPNGVNTYLNTEFNKVAQAYSYSSITILKEPFLSNGNHIKSTRAEQCPYYSSSNYTAQCHCINDSQCGATSATHCTNIDVIRQQSIPNGSVSTNINIMLTANPICIYDTQGYGGPCHTGQSGLYGHAFVNNYSSIVRDINITSNGNTYTLLGSVIAHEIGHMYGLSHHKTNNLPYNNMSNNCLNGLNFDSYYVVSQPNLWFCDYCKLNLTLVRYSYNQSL